MGEGILKKCLRSRAGTVLALIAMLALLQVAQAVPTRPDTAAAALFQLRATAPQGTSSAIRMQLVGGSAEPRKAS
jgi:hypothetical protein